MREIECTYTMLFLGRCEICSWLVEVRVRWETEVFLCGSCLICLTSMHDMKSIRMFEETVTSPEHALVIQGGSLGGVGVGGVMYAI